MQTQEKRKRGRPVGSNSFQSVTLKELIEKYSEDTQIPVGRLWLNGGSTVKETSVTIPATSAAPKEPENRVEMILTVD
jgi:hypothetical protein